MELVFCKNIATLKSSTLKNLKLSEQIMFKRKRVSKLLSGHVLRIMSLFALSTTIEVCLGSLND